MRIPVVLACTSLLVTLLHAAPQPPAADDDQPMAPVAAAAPKVNPAADRYWQALKLLRDGKPSDWPQARALLKQSTDAEFSHAQIFVGLSLMNAQNGYKRDPRQAVGLFRLAAGQGNAFAKFNLGLCYLNGTGVGKDRSQAREWLTATVAADADFSAPNPPADFFQSPTSAGAGNPATLSGELPVSPADRTRAAAECALGNLNAMENKLAEAQEHYVKSATMGVGGRAGLYPAAIKAAINYAFGQGVPRDLGKAEDLLTQSKKLLRNNGLSYAHSLVEKKFVDDFAQADVEEEISGESDKLQIQLQFAIAGSFADPKSKVYDAREAAKWYELASESGEAWAMLSLAFLYQEGRLGHPDPENAFNWFKKAAEKGHHNLGWANVSICYERGLGVVADHAKAAEIWKQNRDRDIVCYLGTIGQCPAAPLTYEQEFELNQNWARKKKDAQAQYLMGIRCLNGWGTKEDTKEAADWFRKAAEANHGQALCELGVLYETRPYETGIRSGADQFRLAFECYEKSAATGNVHALANLGNMYEDGKGCPADTDKAIDCFQKCLAIDPEYARAHNNLGIIYESRCLQARRHKDPVLEAKYLALTYECYRKADQFNFPYGAYNLGQLAYNGVLQKVDLQAAYTYYETAASKGYPTGLIQFKLGHMLEIGAGMPISLREAAYHYRLSALDGNREALVRLCNLYTSTPGFTQDWDRAIFWLSILAKQGDQGALVDIGDALLQKGAYDECLRYFKNMMDSDDPWLQGFAYERLSRLYQNGWGVKANPRKGEKYLMKAVDLGNREALYRQASDLLHAGKTKEAIPFLEKACKQGLPSAIYTIGTLYISGQGLPQNIKTGQRCIKSAADANYPDAMIALVEATLQHKDGAPPLEEAIHYAELAEACNHPRAMGLLEQLEAMRAPASTPAPTENGPARSM
jgi:hypothetical protein